MHIDRNTGLVLEGGGMRGVFTCGVLDAFMKHGLHFGYIVAVSAGACNGLSYLSRQPRRARISNIDYLARYRYIGLRYLFSQGSILDQKLLYDDFPNRLLPFDYDACFANPALFEMVTTDCLTGEACYLSERADRRRLLDIVKASSSLPYVCKPVMVDGRPMLDGGIVDSIPVLRAVSCGHATNVVVLTRPRGYRSSGRDRHQPNFLYSAYPRLREALSRRHETYNRQLDMVDELESKGLVLCLRPSGSVHVGRLEHDVSRLQQLYEEGFEVGESFCRSLFG